MTWSVPLSVGVAIASVAPFFSSTRSVSMMALITNALPVSRWHQVQWQQFTNIGAVASR
jgi:hypothetical protein